MRAPRTVTTGQFNSMESKSRQLQPESAEEKRSAQSLTPENPSSDASNSSGKYRRKADKGELRMRRSAYGPLQWRLGSTPPAAPARFRRWNLVLIAILAFLVMGVFVVARAPHTGNSASDGAKISWKDNDGDASVPRVEPKGSALQQIHTRKPSGQVYNDATHGHHAG